MKKHLLIFIFSLFATTIFAQKAGSLKEESAEIETTFARERCSERFPC